MTMRLLLLLSLFCLALPSVATGREDPRVLECIDRTAKAYGMSSLPLRLLYRMEGGTVGKNSKANKNGSYDIGPMQVNSWWLPKIADAGISESELRDDPCTNVLVGAWIFMQELRRTGDVAKAIARYHSPTAQYQAIYLARVGRHLDAMIAEANRGP